MNDALTREYLIRYSKEQIAKNIDVTAWQDIINYVEPLVPDYTYKTSQALNLCACKAEGMVTDITRSGVGISTLLNQNKKAFSFFSTLGNAGATYFSGLNDRIMYAEYSSKLSLIKLPLLCITGKYDFTVPSGLADEAMLKVGSLKKKQVILPHSGHICMDNEPETFYNEVIQFVEENK